MVFMALVLEIPSPKERGSDSQTRIVIPPPLLFVLTFTFLHAMTHQRELTAIRITCNSRAVLVPRPLADRIAQPGGFTLPISSSKFTGTLHCSQADGLQARANTHLYSQTAIPLATLCMPIS